MTHGPPASGAGMNPMMGMGGGFGGGFGGTGGSMGGGMGGSMGMMNRGSGQFGGQRSMYGGGMQSGFGNQMGGHNQMGGRYGNQMRGSRSRMGHMGYAQASADSSVETDVSKTEDKTTAPSTLAQIESMHNNALF